MLLWQIKKRAPVIKELHSLKEVGIMAVPARRTSKTAKRKRRTHFKLQVPGMVECPNCGEMKLAHRVCKECGTYKGKEVIEK